jgi:hypothetical protein
VSEGDTGNGYQVQLLNFLGVINNEEKKQKREETYSQQ